MGFLKHAFLGVLDGFFFFAEDGGSIIKEFAYALDALPVDPDGKAVMGLLFSAWLLENAGDAGGVQDQGIEHLSGFLAAGTSGFLAAVVHVPCDEEGDLEAFFFEEIHGETEVGVSPVSAGVPEVLSKNICGSF